MAPKYKLIYFNAKGGAEVTRLMFAYGGVEYEDSRFERDEWQNIKPKMPMGQTPVLEVDGWMIPQSGAIARFVARKLGLYGKDNTENTKVDIVLDTIKDIWNPVTTFFQETDETKKAAQQKKYQEETVPPLVSALEKMLIRNDGGDGFFVGKELTLADIAIQSLLDGVPRFAGKAVAKETFPKLFALKDRVEAIPNIAKWLKKRPENEF